MTFTNAHNTCRYQVLICKNWEQTWLEMNTTHGTCEKCPTHVHTYTDGNSTGWVSHVGCLSGTKHSVIFKEGVEFWDWGAAVVLIITCLPKEFIHTSTPVTISWELFFPLWLVFPEMMKFHTILDQVVATVLLATGTPHRTSRTKRDLGTWQKSRHIYTCIIVS